MERSTDLPGLPELKALAVDKLGLCRPSVTAESEEPQG